MKIGSTAISNCKIGSTQVSSIYIGSTLVWQNIDADAQAFITAAGITDATQISAINTLVTSLKAASLWTKFKAIYPFVGGTASTHKFNLKDPRDLDAAFRLAFSGGWTHSATGGLPNGSNAFARTFFYPNANFSNAYSCGAGYYSGTDASGAANAMLFGTIESIEGLPITQVNIQGKNAFQGILTNLISNTYTNYSGLFTVNRSANNLSKSYREGSPIGSEAVAYAGLLSKYNIMLGARANNSDTIAQFYSLHECRFAFINDSSLSDAEQVTFSNIVTAFQTTLGRAI